MSAARLSKARQRGVLLGLGLAIGPMLVRVQGPLDLVPWWDGDPLSQDVVKIGVDPALSVGLDLLSVIGAGIMLWLAPATKRWWPMLMAVVLGGLGVAAVWWHVRGYEGREGVIGSAWCAAVLVGLGVWGAGRGEGGRMVRVALLAVVLGLVGLLALKGLYQVALEHPATVASFKAQRESIFAANGWSPDSPMARAYERRVTQSEASGWFGFANVYASFTAMGVVGFGPITVLAWRRRRALMVEGEEATAWPLVLSGAGLGLSVTALMLAGGKGGFAAAGMGLGLVGLLAWLSGRSSALVVRTAEWIGPLAVVGAVGAVVARGMLGERVGELSLLFRWFYMQASMRIFGAEWLHGVGPDGFQTAYSLAKNPLSPEDVSSPHSVLFDWSACLGIGGVAFGVWLIWLCVGVGRGALVAQPLTNGDGADEDAGLDQRALMRGVCLLAAASTMAAVPLQYEAMLPEEAIGVRVVGLVIWCLLACGVVSVAHQSARWPLGLAGAALPLLLHGQIELTPVLPQSCGLWLAVIAAAAAPDNDGGGPGDAVRWPAWVGVALCLVAGMCTLGLFREARAHVAKLDSAYQQAASIRADREQARLLSAQNPRAGAELVQRLLSTEGERLAGIIATLPTTWPEARSASQIAMGHAQQTAARDPRAAATWAVSALHLANPHPTSPFDFARLQIGPMTEAELIRAFEAIEGAGTAGLTVSRAAWCATLCLAAAESGMLPSPARWLELGGRYMERAAASDPHNPSHAVRLMDLRLKQGQPEQARLQAATALRLNQLQRLDPARMLSERELTRVERIAGGK